MLNELLALASKIAEEQGYTIGKVKISTRQIQGLKVGYACGAKKGDVVTGSIVIDSRFAEYGQVHKDELLDVIKHELAHLVAETSNATKKRIWHGDAWKKTHKSLGGTGERYYSGTFVKPENKDKVFKTMEELRTTKATQPADTWERGTFRQWLERGYHVIKGQKGSLSVWEFKGDAYEGDDGKEKNGFGRASAFYFTADQVEANK